MKNNAKVGGQISCELSLLRGHSIVGQWSSGVKRSFHSYAGQESNAACKEGCDGRSCKKAAKKQTDHCKHGDIVSILKCSISYKFIGIRNYFCNYF